MKTLDDLLGQVTELKEFLSPEQRQLLENALSQAESARWRERYFTSALKNVLDLKVLNDTLRQRLDDFHRLAYELGSNGRVVVAKLTFTWDNEVGLKLQKATSVFLLDSETQAKQAEQAEDKAASSEKSDGKSRKANESLRMLKLLAEHMNITVEDSSRSAGERLRNLFRKHLKDAHAIEPKLDPDDVDIKELRSMVAEHVTSS